MAHVFPGEHPSDPMPVYPLVIAPQWHTLISQFDSGKEQRRQKQLFPTYNIKVRYNALTRREMEKLWNFYMARKGALESFYFFDKAVHRHTNQFIGIGDGQRRVFDIPAKDTKQKGKEEGRIVYVNGKKQSTNVQTGQIEKFITGEGIGGSDQVKFKDRSAFIPAMGEVLTCDFTGRLRIRCRFAQDNLSRELFATMLFRFGIELKGLSDHEGL